MNNPKEQLAGLVKEMAKAAEDTGHSLGWRASAALYSDKLAAILATLPEPGVVTGVTDEMVEIVGKQLWRYWGDVKGAAARTYRNKTRKALEDALAAAKKEAGNG